MPADTPPTYVPPAYGTFGWLDAPIYEELRRQDFEHRLSIWTTIRMSEPKAERDW